MSILSRISKGNSALPPRIVLAGPEGIGKSTFASKAPSPLFISAEDGLTGLDHVQRLTPADFSEVLDLVDELTTETAMTSAKESSFKTLVIDTADWLERLIYSHICKRDNQPDIEGYGYGKGYIAAEAELVKLFGRLDQLRHSRKMGIIILSHVNIRTFNSPEGSTWDRYEMKGNKRMTGILREWPDACLFAIYEVHKLKQKGGGKDIAVGGERIMHTSWSPGWDAKNRLNLPETLPLEWSEFEKACAGNSTVAIREQVEAAFKTAKLGKEDQVKWSAWMKTVEEKSADTLTRALEVLKAKQ